MKMKNQIKKLAQKSGKLTLVEAVVLFVSVAVSTFIVCKALDKSR